MKITDMAIARQRYIQRYISLYRANLRLNSTFHVSGLFELESVLLDLFGVSPQYLTSLREKLSNSLNQTNPVDVNQNEVKTVLL